MRIFIEKTVNAIGQQEIAQFLLENHKLGHKLNEENIRAWARDAENQMSMGNPPCIEIKSWESVHGHTQEFEVSDKGVDFEEFEIEE